MAMGRPEMDDRALLAAAELARRNGIWDRAINTADLTVAAHDFTLRYLVTLRRLFSRSRRASGNSMNRWSSGWFARRAALSSMPGLRRAPRD